MAGTLESDDSDDNSKSMLDKVIKFLKTHLGIALAIALVLTLLVLYVVIF